MGKTSKPRRAACCVTSAEIATFAVGLRVAPRSDATATTPYDVQYEMTDGAEQAPILPSD